MCHPVVEKVTSSKIDCLLKKAYNLAMKQFYYHRIHPTSTESSRYCVMSHQGTSRFPIYFDKCKLAAVKVKHQKNK